MKFQDKLTRHCLIMLSVCLSACNAGNGEGLDEQGQPLTDIQAPDPTPIDEEEIQARLSPIQKEIFTPICSVCHGGASPAAGQNLSTIADSIANLINVQSSNPLFKRVLPGSPEESYLYLKITGDSQAGARMPLGQPALAEEQINAIKNWIANGALTPENLGATKVSRVAQTTTSDMRRNNTAQVTLWFSQAMDFTSLTREQITLRIANRAVDSDDASFRLTNKALTYEELTYEQADIRAVNDHMLLINLAIPAPYYPGPEKSQLQITLNNSSISTLTSILGQTLDGDNNGIEGGEFTYDLAL
ncbi:c-type cytochrome [Thalassomonas haliotis]|uniref:Cytochrome c n=1 Tax=Thalassomonas haliotis TaxID=485448 RepID=A0ABY7VHU9_9GAMM|nr:cytochrome c [Thalassomonas haliotis]WDE12610.1 cytochrome c [Thalassomonas haliotis]